MDKNIIVETEIGKLKGKISYDWKNNIFYSFQGVPYAKPPIGLLRFKGPQPVEPWTGIYDATFHRDMSYQLSNGELIGSEDCLYLNIYTPKISSEINAKKLPIMFWVHGGFLHYGSGDEDDWGPEYLVSEEVILVTVNYRLNVYGFLKIDDPKLDVPGNAGMKDVIMALKWVQNNIQYFNGDPKNVTLLGASAGAHSIHSIMASQLSEGLFHKVVLESGGILSYWPNLWPSPATDLVKHLGYEDVKTDEEALNILKNADPKALIDARFSYDDAQERQGVRTFGLEIENKGTEGAFLTNNPINILRDGALIDVPIIMGYNTSEGMVRFKPTKLKLEEMNKWLPKTNEDFQRLLPIAMDLPIGSELSKFVADKVKQFYFKDHTENEDLIYDYINLQSDLYYIWPIYSSALIQSSRSQSPLYFYRFDYQSNMNSLKVEYGLQHLKGCGHYDETGYLFKQKHLPEPNENEKILIESVIKRWTNFAKTSNPNVPGSSTKWLPFKESTRNFINFDNKKITTGTNVPEKERIEFWDSLFKSVECLRKDFSK